MHLVIRRLLEAIVTILGAITIVFLILRLTPGDPAEIILGEYATPELVEQTRKELGLNKSIPEQYVIFLGDLITGDLGRSVMLRQDVTSLVTSSLKYTFELAIASIFVTIAVGIPLGLVAAIWRNSIADYFAMFTALIGVSMPSFWLALVVIYIFSFNLGWFPVQGAGEEGFIDRIHHLMLPAGVLGIGAAGLTARTTRSAVLEMLSEDYVRTARAKGLRESRVVWSHVFRNALIPILTVLGITFGQLLAGSAVIEIVFGRPGLGKLLVDSILARDYPLSQGLVIVFLLVITTVNLVVDMSYGILDPRIRAN
jgi:ABC-type dipeptide/oligopeptide/nickel transport system permease component